MPKNSIATTPPTRAKVLEAAACGALVITPPTQCLEMYFSEDQIFVFRTGKEFREICDYVKHMDNDEVVEKQKAVFEYTRHHHDCIRFIKRHILTTIEALQSKKRQNEVPIVSPVSSDFNSQQAFQTNRPSAF